MSATTVVLGASGVVGGGVVRKLLDAGHRVVAVSRSADRLAKLRGDIGVTAEDAKRLVDVVADFTTDKQAAEAEAAVSRALGGAPYDHVVSALGFVVIRAPPTSSSVDELRSSLEDGLFNNFLAAKAFLPKLKDRKGATFTLTSGGMAHAVFAPAMWNGTIKNQALHSLTLGLAKEFEADAVRVNCVCIHLPLAPNHAGAEAKNQLGMKAEGNGVRFAPAYLGVMADASTRGQIVCVSSYDEVDKWGAKAAAVWGKAPASGGSGSAAKA